MLNNKKKTVTKSQLMTILKSADISVATTYDVVSDKDRKEVVKDIESKSKKGNISIVLIETK